MSSVTHSPVQNPQTPSGSSSDHIGRALRSASLSEDTQLAHPTPDLQSLQGAYVQNVERLEEKAERMSMGSNVAEEIRKMHWEQKQSDSRRSSLQSASNAGLEASASNPKLSYAPRPRNVSNASYTNSIVELNGNARYGGYSPANFVGSSRGSIKSGSWSQISPPGMTSRPLSESVASRLGQIADGENDMIMVESPTEEFSRYSQIPNLDMSASRGSAGLLSAGNEQEQDTLRMASDGSLANLYNSLVELNGDQTHLAAPRVPSNASFTDVYDQIASEIQIELDNAAGEPSRLNANASLKPKDGQRRISLFDVGTSQANVGDSEIPPPVPPHASRVPPSAISIAPISEQIGGLLPSPVFLEHRTSSDGGGSSRGPSRLQSPDGGPDRPTTARSGDTYQQAQSLFQDFDGAHYAPSFYEASLRDVSGGSSLRPQSMLKVLPDRTSRIPPPPADGMVYYPAPVPRMLNLPQRLSVAPSPAVQAKRRTQVLSQMNPDARKSAPWLALQEKRASTTNLLEQRKSVMSMANLPQQLRASVFFESPGLQEDVEIQNESAVATLDVLLDAAAHAPVSAFTDHPIVGHIGAEVYRRAPPKPAAEKKEEDLKKRRSSFLGLRRKSISAADELEAKRSATPGKMQRKSRAFSLGANLDDSALARGPDDHIEGANRPDGSPALEGAEGDEEAIESEGDEEEQEPEEEEEVLEYIGQPTTLLAELQLRKAQQKTRSRTAATSYPNGMHSTLLELDAVAQLEKSKRKRTRVALAWEDPEMHAAFDPDNEDDDVPLGMLFPGKEKRDPRDLNRPMGLLERRELEENEPLSNRRNRLLGIEPQPRVPSPSRSPAPAVHINGIEADEDNVSNHEHEGETLGQRMRRLRNQRELDDALGDVAVRPVSTAFSVEMLNELGLDANEDNGNGLGNNTPMEEETLGQRRKRLQKEALGPKRASRMSLNADDALNQPGNRASTMPGIRSSSMADILQTNPSGENASKRVSSGNMLENGNPGGLLERSAEEQSYRRQALVDANKRSTSYGHDTPLLNAQQHEMRRASTFMNGGTPYGAQSSSNLLGLSGGMSAMDQQMAAQYAQQYQAAYGYNPYGNLMYAQSGYSFAQPAYGYGYGMPMGYAPNAMYMGSMPNLAQQPSHRQSTNGLATMSSSNLLANMGGALHSNSRGGAAAAAAGANAAYARHSTFGVPGQGLGMMNMNMNMQADPSMDDRGRSRIDQWRQSIQP